MAKLPIFPNTGRRIKEYPIASGQTFTQGAAVVLSGGEITECGADPASILGFALHKSGTLPDESVVLVAIAEDDATFFAEGDNAPVDADVGTEIGIAVDGDGDWFVDGADVVNVRVVILDIDKDRELYEFKVIEANRQIS